MRQIIRIAELSHIPTPAHDTYSPAEMEAARAVMVQRNLRWDNATGVTRDDRMGLLSRPSNPAEHEPLASEDEVMRWAFRPCIANSASRVSRGYSA